MSAPRKRYSVPVIHHVSFGLEVEVEAESEEQAKALALDPNAEVDGGYDWDRMNFQRAELGNWKPIEEVEP